MAHLMRLLRSPERGALAEVWPEVYERRLNAASPRQRARFRAWALRHAEIAYRAGRPNAASRIAKWALKA